MKMETWNMMMLFKDDDDGCKLHEFRQLGWMLYKGNKSLGAPPTHYTSPRTYNFILIYLKLTFCVRVGFKY